MANHTEYVISGPEGIMAHGIVEENGKVPVPIEGECYVRTRRLNDAQTRDFRKRNKGDVAQPRAEDVEQEAAKAGDLPRWGYEKQGLKATDKPRRGGAIQGDGNGQSVVDDEAERETDTSADAKEQARVQEQSRQENQAAGRSPMRGR